MNFPLDLRFRVLSLAAQISVTDAAGTLICYVKQKAFKLREAVTVYSDTTRTVPLYTINADRVIDFSAQYRIDDTSGATLGVLRRHGMRSIWRAHYEIVRDGVSVFHIREQNPWSKVFDHLLAEIPFLGLLTGYVFHPAYGVSRVEGAPPVIRAEKRPSLFGTHFEIERLGAVNEDEERLVVMSLLMMLILERRRG